MPSFTMAELMAQQFGGASDARSTHPENNQRVEVAVGRRRRRMAGDTIVLIRNFMAEQKEPVLLMDICDMLERRPGPHLRKILAEMVAAGEMTVEQDWGAGPQVPRYWYSKA